MGGLGNMNEFVSLCRIRLNVFAVLINGMLVILGD